MKWPELTNEISNDPLTLGYSSMTDQELSDSLNAKTRSAYTYLYSNELLSWAAGGADDGEGVLPRILRIQNASNKSGSFTSLPDSIVGIAAAAYLLITRDGTSLNFNRSDQLAMVDALVAYGVLTSTEKTELLALSTITLSRAEELVLEGEPTVADIVKVRSWL